jgi:hypothetical protein
VIGFTLADRHFQDGQVPKATRLKVSVTVSQLARDGRVRSVVKRREGRVWLHRTTRLTFPTLLESAIYRFDIEFKSLDGTRVARYGQYFRSAPPHTRARIGLRSANVLPGDTLSAWFENLGTTRFSTGFGYQIQRFNGDFWEVDPTLRYGLFPRVLVRLGPTEAFDCFELKIPDNQPVGRYRLVKEIRRSHPMMITEEFRVTSESVGIQFSHRGFSAHPAHASQAKGRARDCTSEARLSKSAASRVDYVVWCGVQSGRVALRIRRPDGSPPVAFSRRPRVSGPGAAGPFVCRAARGGRISCEGKKDGPVTIRGSLAFAAESRCVTRLSLNLWQWTGDFFTTPVGCPRGYRGQRLRPLREIIAARAEDGLDLDLAGDREAIVRRARQLQQAWLRGDPVARWTSEEEAFGMPLRAFEQAELEYRDRYRERFQDLVEDGDWVEKNAASTWAGYEIDSRAGGIIYVGFTAEPEAMLEKLKRLLIAPDRFRPFPVPPKYTERELWHILETFWPDSGPLSRLINSSGIDYLANKVEVGTEHVARVRRLLAELYGPEAPFEVVFEGPAIPQ